MMRALYLRTYCKLNSTKGGRVSYYFLFHIKAPHITVIHTAREQRLKLCLGANCRHANFSHIMEEMCLFKSTPSTESNQLLITLNLSSGYTARDYQH